MSGDYGRRAKTFLRRHGRHVFGWSLVAILAVVGVRWIFFTPGDLGGRVLHTLSGVEAAVPADAQVQLNQQLEPRCGYQGGHLAGYTDVVVNVRFTSRQPDHDVLDFADSRLSARGWSLRTTSSAGYSWTRTVSSGDAKVSLVKTGTRNGLSHWALHAWAPPQRSHGFRC